MKYTILDFNTQFPTDDACLDFLFKERKLKGYKRVKGRKCYQNIKGEQFYPLKGTIFEKSTTPLRLWFYAIYLFSVSKHGVSAAELERQLGVTYKCAFRMGHKIRSLMNDSGYKLRGIVECDEAYMGGQRRLNVRASKSNKTPVFGMVERGGKVVAYPMENTKYFTLYQVINKHIPKSTTIMSDSYSSYLPLKHDGWKHKSVNHNKWEYVRKEGRKKIHTNTIEGFWSHMKNGIAGTHRYVSKQYLSSYVSEAAFRYNQKGLLFPLLLNKVLDK